MGYFYKSIWFWLLISLLIYPTYAFITHKGDNAVGIVFPSGLTPLSVGKSNREQSRTGLYSDASIFTQNTRRRAVQKQLVGPTKTSYQSALDYYFTNGINYLLPPPPPPPAVDTKLLDNGNADTDLFYREVDNGYANTVSFSYEYDGGVIDNVIYRFPALDGGTPTSILLYSVDGGQYNSVYIPELNYDGGNI